MRDPAIDLFDVLPVLHDELDRQSLRRVLERLIHLAEQRLAHHQELAELQAQLDAAGQD